MFRLLTLGLTLALAAQAEQTLLLVLEKGASALAFYTPEGKLLEKVAVGKHPHEMVLAKDGRQLFITDNGTMKIEEEGQGGNTVSVVDIVERKRTKRINLGRYRRPHGINVDPATGRIGVSTELPNRILIIDPESHEVIRNFDTQGDTSHMITFGPDKTGAEYAYVSNSREATLSVVHLTTGLVAKIPTRERPEGSVLSVDGTELFVCNRDGASITIVDTARRAVKGEIKTNGKGPVRIGVTPDGRYLVYSLMQERKVEFVDLQTRKPIAQVALSGEPVSLSVSRDGKYVLAAAEASDTVYVISAADRKLVREFQTEKGAGPDPVLMVTVP